MEPVNPYASSIVEEWVESPRPTDIAFGNILNTGLRLYMRNLPTIALVTIIVWTPLEIFQAYMEYFVFEPDDLRSTFRLHRGLENFFGIIVTGGVVAIADASVRGEWVSVWEALGEGVSAWPRLFWARLVRGFLLLLAFLALIIPGLYFSFRLILVDEIAVIEHLTGMNSMKRSMELTQKKFWLMVGLVVLPYTILVILAGSASMPLILFPEIDHWLLSAAISIAVDVLMQVPTVILVAAYFACAASSSASRQYFAASGEPPRTSMPPQQQPPEESRG